MSKFYITTSIPYANGTPHLGHTLDFIQADVLARYAKLQGKEVKFSTGTDEHGSKIKEKAESLNSFNGQRLSTGFQGRGAGVSRQDEKASHLGIENLRRETCYDNNPIDP